MKKLLAVVLSVACAPCVQWTRFIGTVRSIDLKASTVTIQDRDGGLLLIPVDYQVHITEKHGEDRDLKSLHLDDKIMLIRIPVEPPDKDTGPAPAPEPTPHGL